MAQQLRIHIALPEGLGFNYQHPRQVVHNCLQFQPQGGPSTSGLCGYMQTHTPMHVHTHTRK